MNTSAVSMGTKLHKPDGGVVLRWLEPDVWIVETHSTDTDCPSHAQLLEKFTTLIGDHFNE